MNPNDPRINEYIRNIRQVIDGGRPTEEVARITYQVAYAAGFNDGLFADPEVDMSKLLEQLEHRKDATSATEDYFPKEKTCPACGHKWGGV